MLNYSGGDFATQYMASSVQAAETAYGTADGLYAGGWYRHIDISWPLLNQDEATKRCGLLPLGRAQNQSFLPICSGKRPHGYANELSKVVGKRILGGVSHTDPTSGSFVY